MPEINQDQKRCLQLARSISTTCFRCSDTKCSDDTCSLHVWNGRNKQWMQWNGVLAADAILSFCCNRCGSVYARCSDRPEGKECPLHTGLRLAVRTFGKVKP